jgi:hypothetical protein
MSFPKFHGIELAQNSWIKNLVIESLPADPAAPAHGRVWLNATQDVLKYATIAPGIDGAPAITTIHSIYDQASADAANSVLNIAITNLNAGLAQEVIDRTAADDVLELAITAETLARTLAIAQLDGIASTAIEVETAARVAADAVVAATAADQLATEVAARLAGDAAQNLSTVGVQAELDATQAGAGLSVAGTYIVPVGSTHLDTSTSLANADALLDAALAAETAARQGGDAAQASALANESQLRVDGDSALSNTLTAYINSAITNNVNADNAETVLRIAADQALQAELDATQASIGLATDGTLIPIVGTNYLDGATTVFGGAINLDIQLKRVDVALTGEIAARDAADVIITTDLNAEIAARTAADNAQQEEINTTQAGAGLETDGTYAAPTDSNYLNNAITLKDADFKLDAALKAVSDSVVSLAASSSSSSASAIEAERNARIAGDAAEQERALLAEAALSAALVAETARATAAEVALGQAIADANAERAASATAVEAARVAAATAVEAARVAAATAATAAAAAAAAALTATLLESVFTFKSSTPGLVHAVNHAMGSEFLLYSVMVKGDDGVFRNDIVPVVETDLNTMTITLTEVRDIKVVVKKVA